MASRRNDRLFCSATRKDLLRFPSNRQSPGPSKRLRPRLPRLPGNGFCSRTRPLLASATAFNVQDVWRPCSAVTEPHCGSLICFTGVLKKVPLLAPSCHETFPFDGKGPTTSAVPFAYNML